MFHYDLAPNSPELSLLKFLLLTYHHSHFLAATLDFTSFSQWPSWGPHTLFYSWAIFGLDTTFCMLQSWHIAINGCCYLSSFLFRINFMYADICSAPNVYHTYVFENFV